MATLREEVGRKARCYANDSPSGREIRRAFFTNAKLNNNSDFFDYVDWFLFGVFVLANISQSN